MTETNDSSDQGIGSYRFTILIAAAAFLCYFFTSYRIDENEQTIGVIALLSILVGPRWWSVSAWPWLIVLATMLITLAQRPIDVPNHHFVMTYVAAAIILTSLVPAAMRSETLCENARWMLIVLMAFATVQKALSPTFRDGSYLGYELARGGFARPIIPLLGEPSKKMFSNDEKLEEFRSQDPREVPSVELELPTSRFVQVAYGFAIAILAIELWLAVMMWIAPGALVTHLSLIAFIVSLGVLRQEFTFISVVSAMGLMASDPSRTVLRGTYATLSVLTAAAILKTLN